MSEGRLARRLGRLLLAERHKAGLTQQSLAARAGLPREQVARFEAGRHGVTARVAEVLFEALGFQIRPELESLDAALDKQIAKARVGAAPKLEILLYYWHLHRMIHDRPLDLVFDGPLAALLQGVPILATKIDFMVKEADLDELARWFRRIGGMMRYEERWREFSGYDSDPRRPGAMRWHGGHCELAVKVVAEFGRTVTIAHGDKTFKVRPLHEVAEDHIEVARVLNRIRASG